MLTPANFNQICDLVRANGTGFAEVKPEGGEKDFYSITIPIGGSDQVQVFPSGIGVGVRLEYSHFQESIQ